MAYLLHIDTSMDTGSICISQDDRLISVAVNANRDDQAAWMHEAIRDIMNAVNWQLKQLNAISISIGPGSYTGLRIGLSAVKGLCYAMSLPLITIPTLQMIAKAAYNGSGRIYIPMIDARRMEVYTAVYDDGLVEKSPVRSLILDQNSFDQWLSTNSVVFCGNGSLKFQQLSPDCKAEFSPVSANATHLIELAFQKFNQQDFADLSYTEPLYVKEFYTTSH